MSVYESWTHGNSVLLERVKASNATGKSGVNNSFRGETGDIVDLGVPDSAVACLRLGWAARFVAFDSGKEDKAKSGSFWCHYAIPTPVIEADARAEADQVLVNFESSDINALRIAAVHVWDGNRRIFAADTLIPTPANNYDGGIRGRTTDSGTRPATSRLWRGDIRRQPIYFGVGVSLLIRAHEAKDEYLEIRGVGVDFEAPK